MTTTSRRLLALAVGLLLLLTACAGSDDTAGSGDDSGGGEGRAATADADALAVEPSSGESASGAPSPQVDLGAAAEDRQIVSTATLTLRVDELDPAVDRVNALVDDLGGLIYGEDTDLRSGAVTHLTVKVPPAEFRNALSALADLGEVETQTVSTDDVTEQVVDLDSRISTAEASVERLRGLLLRAERIQDITTIEGQLLQRETDLETLRGQRRTIERQVALATVDVTLSAERTSPPPPEEEDTQPGFFDGLRGGADALKTFAVGVSAVAGALLPWSPLLLGAAYVLWRTTRRKPLTTDSGR
jgi:hypothetical protein